jgi:predicted RNA-binding protein YlxR (DUF448 family)
MKTPPAKQTPAARREPQRTCVGCREVKTKRELVRLVLTADGTVELDETGKANGRGAYICKKAACWEQALQGNRLEHTFRSTVKQDNRDRLKARASVLLKEMTSGQDE